MPAAQELRDEPGTDVSSRTRDHDPHSDARFPRRSAQPPLWRQVRAEPTLRSVAGHGTPAASLRLTKWFVDQGNRVAHSQAWCAARGYAYSHERGVR